MSAIEKIKRRREHGKELEAIINRVALEHALWEEFGDDAWAEVRVEYTSAAHSAILHTAGHAPIHAHMESGEDGIGWRLSFGVGDMDRGTLRYFSVVADALLYAGGLENRVNLCGSRL